MIKIAADESKNADKYGEADAFIFVIISHGNQGEIFGSDCIHVPLYEFFDLFDGENCKPLVGKPKIFMVAACRGGKSLCTRVSLYWRMSVDTGDNEYFQLYLLQTVALTVSWHSEWNYHSNGMHISFINCHLATVSGPTLHKTQCKSLQVHGPNLTLAR